MDVLVASFITLTCTSNMVKNVIGTQWAVLTNF